MTIKEAIALILQNVARYLADKFSGKLVFTFHCRNGGIGRLSLTVEQELSSNSLDMVETEKQ